MGFFVTVVTAEACLPILKIVCPTLLPIKLKWPLEMQKSWKKSIRKKRLKLRYEQISPS